MSFPTFWKRASACVLVSAFLVFATAFDAGAITPGTLFGQRYIDITDPGMTEKWRATAEALARDSAALEACLEEGACPSSAIQTWRDMVRLAQDDPRGPLVAVQDLVDEQVRFADDPLSGSEGGDAWASPLQTLGRGFGDCEDIAILKLATLKHLGLDMAAMRLVVLKLKDATGLTSPMHAVLLVETEAGRLVLDNLEGAPLPEDAAFNYQPLYALSLEERNF